MDTLSLRPVAPGDSPELAGLIRTVMPEFGACGEGFAIKDPEVSHMYEAYSRPRHAYFVVTDGNRVLGGGGVAPLSGGAPETCELRKMYFLPQARGKGWGRKMLRQCLVTAKELGFKHVYLETLTGMDSAKALYLKMGFRPLDRPMGRTGHFGCDQWFLLKLEEFQ